MGRKPVIYFFDIRENVKIVYYERNLNNTLEYIDKKINENTKYIYIDFSGLYKMLLEDILCRKYNLSKIEYYNYMIKNPFYELKCIIL